MAGNKNLHAILLGEKADHSVYIVSNANAKLVVRRSLVCLIPPRITEFVALEIFSVYIKKMKKIDFWLNIDT